jgi:hypothetical protein
MSRRQRRPRSVHSGCVGCVIEPRNGLIAGAETVSMVERNTGRNVTRGTARPAGVEEHITRKRIASELGRSRVRPEQSCCGPRREEPKPMMHERGKSAPRSSREAGEQGGAIRCGAGGANGWDRGECKPAQHGLYAATGNRVTSAGAHTTNRNHSGLPSGTRGRSRMRESCKYGSVRGARE